MTASAKRSHWPEYAMEAAGLGAFMISACFFGVLLEHPASPVHRAIGAPLARRLLMGIAMGSTAAAIIYSPWGKRSGAHLNPAVTFTFWRLGKVESRDALLYALAQFSGGAAGVVLAAAALRPWIADPHVNWVATSPGGAGLAAAFAAEVAISFVLMLTVLTASNHPRASRYTGLLAASLVAVYITFEAPLSGMSMNPARTLASALSAGRFTGLWIYFTAPPLGMLLAAEAYLRARGAKSVLCAKLQHDAAPSCLFRCCYAAASASPRTAGSSLHSQRPSEVH
jgi:aquaporin Z